MKNVSFPNKWLIASAFAASFLYNQVAVSYEEENMAVDDAAPVVDDMPVDDVGTPEDILADEPVAQEAKAQLPKETVTQKKARAAKKPAKKEVKKEVATAPETKEATPATTTVAATTTDTTAAASTTASAEAAPAETTSTPAASDKIISDGSPITIEKLGVAIAPPVGWEVLQNEMGMSLVLREQGPAEEPEMKPGEEKITFKRNITVVAMHETSPIDENEAANIKEKLNEQFGKQTGIENFQVLEHKFFDYKGKNDGMVIYSAFVMNSIPMAQMHVLIAGQNNRFLLTYTDLASEFEANQEAYNKAWNTMSTIAVIGNAPVRYENLKVYGAVAAGVAFLIGLLLFYRRRRAIAQYQSEDVHGEPSVSGGENSSVSSLWSLDGGAMSDMAPISAVSQISDVGQFNFGEDKEDFNNGIDFSDVTPLSNVSNIR